MSDAPQTKAQNVSDDWLQWIAENRLRDCTPESMLTTMVDAGVDAELAQQAIAQTEQQPIFKAARLHQQLQRKLESVMANQQRIKELAGQYAQVEKIATPGAAEFFERYVVGCRPVVLTNVAADWPALTKWSPQHLRERYGRHMVEIQAERSKDPKYEQNKLKHRQSVKLADFVDKVLAGGATNDYYMTANNEALKKPEFAPLLFDIGSLPAICDRAALARSCSVWFGPAGTITPLHHDTLMLFHTQIVGRKRWRFISPLDTPKLYNFDGVFSSIDLEAPDYAKFPLLKDVKILEVVAQPGETVFLPLGWWHQVTSLDTSLSFSFSNLSIPNDYPFANPSIRHWH
jgi:Cupin-like domain